MTKNVLALDIGTSVIKGSVFNEAGEAISSSSEPVESNGAGYVNPNQIWEKTLRVISGAREIDGVNLQIDSVIATGQGDGLWMLQDGVQTPERAYLWSSNAGSDVIQEFEKNEIIQKHFDASGTILWSGASVALWKWFKLDSPEAAKRTTTVFNAKDFINFKLTGKIATDLTDATIPFANPSTGGYSEEAFELLDAKDLRGLVADILPSGQLIGTLTKEAATLTGLSETTSVHMGVLDVVAMLLGSGLETEGDVLAVLGTTAASISIVPSGYAPREPAGATIFLGNGKSNLRVMGSSSGTATLDWYMRNLGYEGSSRYQELWDEISSTKRSGEIFLPFLNGERAPFLAPKATGSLLGITSETSRGSIARAVVEGVTMSLNHGIHVAAKESEIAELGQVTLCGGGSSSSEWAQLVANTTGARVRVDNRSDLGAIGVASILIPSIKAKAKLSLSEEKIYSPNADHVLMQKKYLEYLKYVDMLRSTWH